MVGTKDFQDVIDEANEYLTNQQERNEVIKSLAQYTSVEALRSITNNLVGIGDRTYFILRATSALHTNDREELKHGYDYMIETLKLIEKTIDGGNCPDYLFLSSYAEELRESENWKDITLDQIRRWFYSGNKTPFVISLTRKVDNLSMWNKSYGRIGEGVCMLLDFSKMEYLNSKLLINIPMMIAYKGRPGYSGTTNALLTLILEICNIYYNEAKKSENTNILELKLQAIKIMCAFVSSYIKGSQWHDEQEWRIMCTTRKGNSDCIKNDDLNRPYVEVPVPLSCLKKIIFGPKVYDDIVYKFQQNAQNIGLTPDDIYKSEAPLK